MYESYYGLRRLPFENVLDTSFYYPSYGHREALSAVIYAINHKKGLVVVAGHPGTGKSFLIQLVKEQLLETDYVIEIKSRIDLVKGLVERLEEVLSITPDEDFTQYRQDKLAKRLEELGAKGGRIILLIDEAQTLNEEEMEYIRLLWNIESKSGKLIQTILVGQKELLDLLRKEEMQATLQRVQVFRVLKGLDLEDTKRYVKTRLNAAGSDEMVFTDDGIELVHKLSRGYLRMINQLCDQGMMSAYVSKNAFVGAEQIKAVVAENPIYMDVYEQDIEDAIASRRSGSEIEDKRQAGSRKRITREENWSESPEIEVIADKKSGNHQWLSGMVIGAIMIGIAWLVVSSLERQEALEKSTQQVASKVTAQEEIDYSTTETVKESGPLFTIGKLEELTDEEPEQTMGKEQLGQVVDEPEATADESAKGTEDAGIQDVTQPGESEVLPEEQFVSEELRAANKEQKNNLQPLSPATTEEPKAVGSAGIQTESEKVTTVKEPARVAVAPAGGEAVEEEEKKTAIVQGQAYTGAKNNDAEDSATAVAEVQVKEVAGRQEQATGVVKSIKTGSEPERRFVGVNQDIPFPFAASSEVAAEEIKVVEGKSLSKLALEKYGAWNWTLEDILTHVNTGIDRVDFIQADSSIKLPVLTREQMLVQNPGGKYYVYLKTVDIEKVRSERGIYQEQGADVRLQEVILSGHRKIRLYLGPMSDESLARDRLKMVQYNFAPFALK